MKYTLFLQFIDLLAGAFFTQGMVVQTNGVNPAHVANMVAAANSIKSSTIAADKRDPFDIALAFVDYYIFMKTNDPPIAGVGLPSPGGKTVDNAPAD